MNNIIENETAILFMDIQKGIVNILPDSKHEWLNSTKYIYENIRKKYKKMLIIHVVIEFCNNFIDINPNNKLFMNLKEIIPFTNNNELSSIHEYFIPQNNDIIIKRSRASAFFNTNLDTILRSNNIKNIILCGVSTSGVILSTLRCASDRDYKVFIIKEGVIDPDIELEKILIEKYFPSQSEVINYNDLNKFFKL